MESFGLFDLLKSLSFFNQQSPAPTQEKNTSSSPQEPPSNPTVPKTETQTTPIPIPPKNACLDFINRHDELAKRRKRK